MRVLAIDTALGACAAAVLDSQRRRDPRERIARDGARPRRSGDAADRARDGRGRAANSPISTASPSRSGRAASPACASAFRRRAASRSRPASPRSASPRSSALAAPHVAARADHTIIAAIDARNEQVYFQVFAPNGTTIVAPRLDRVRAAVRAVPVGPARDHRLGRGACRRALAERVAGAACRGACRRPTSAGSRASAPPRRTKARRRSRSICAGPMRARRTPAGCRADEGLARPAVRAAPSRRSATAQSARRRRARRAARGVVQSRLERARIRAAAHRSQRDRGSRGERAQPVSASSCRAAPPTRRKFSPSRSRASWRGRGLARRLLDLHLRRLAGLGLRAVFLEVDEDNAPARRLYARAGFREVGRRPGYYAQGRRQAAAALVLRRDLA